MALVLLLVVASAVTVSSQFTIYHASEFRGIFNPFTIAGEEVGGIARIHEIIKQPSNRKFIYTGSLIYEPYSTDATRLDIELDVLTEMGVDALVPGDNEFKLAPVNFLRFLERATSPILSTNIRLPKAVPEVKMDDKLIILGYISKHVQNYPAGASYNVKDIIAALNAQTKKYETLGKVIFIAAGCSSINEAMKIGKETDGIHIVISGCSEVQENDTETSSYPLTVKNKHGSTVRIAHVPGSTKFIGRLDIKLDGLGNLQECTGSREYVNSTKSNNAQLSDLLNELDALRLGHAAVYLNGKCDKRECNLGNMITNAFVQYKSDMYEGDYWTDTPIALMPADNIKKSINASTTRGVIYLEYLNEAIPTPQILVTVEILGGMLQKTLVSAIENEPKFKGKFLQVSGLHVRYDRRNKLGRRMVAFMCRCAECNIPLLADFRMKRRYKVITTEDLVGGAHGHHLFANSAKIIQTENITDWEAVARYIRKMKNINTRIEERIRIVRKQSSAELLGIKKDSVMLLAIIMYSMLV